MKNKYRTSEQVAMKLELESYKGNYALEELYILLLKTQEKADCLAITKDLERVRSNMDHLKRRIGMMPEWERDFLFDVYIDMETDTVEIMKKYGLTRSSYHRYIDKVVYAFSQLDE